MPYIYYNRKNFSKKIPCQGEIIFESLPRFCHVERSPAEIPLLEGALVGTDLYTLRKRCLSSHFSNHAKTPDPFGSSVFKIILRRRCKAEECS